ncbi:MAG: hypothetical protein K6B69_12560 [Lachnospiraceae bacterium]|nr:hypothetical protein [Lachnospiraceae bacterium]
MFSFKRKLLSTAGAFALTGVAVFSPLSDQLALDVYAEGKTVEETEPNEKFDQAQSIELGDIINGRIENGSDKDVYSFVVSTPGRVKIDVTSYSEYRLILRDEDGKVLLEKAYGYGLNQTVGYRIDKHTVDLDEGKYYLSVSAYWNIDKGNYKIQTSFETADVTEKEPNSIIEKANPIEIGDMVHGIITMTESSNRYDWYKFEVKEPVKLQLETTSYIENHYIRILNEKEEEVFYEGNIKIDSQHTYRDDTYECELNAGVYYLLFAGYDNKNQRNSYTGNYTFCLTEMADTYTGIRPVGSEFQYFENGSQNFEKYGFVDYEGGKFLVANGKVATEINGIAIDPDNPLKSYYCANGQVQDQYTGLAQYDGAWFMVTKGVMDATVKGFISYDTGLFYVGAGQVQGVNGLAQDPNHSSVWYFCADGQAQLDYTGLALYDGKWFYVVKGRFQDKYSGNVQYNGSTFQVKNGMVQ